MIAPVPSDSEWFRTANGYQVYPASFADSNGDGIGDLPGITAALPYLRDLGITLLWLSPIYRSPFRDGGYDVIDHYAIDPRYGTLADLDELLKQAHTMGIRVLLDLIPGHTSDEHPWFRASAQAIPNQFSDRYMWTDSAFTGGDGLAFSSGTTPRDGAHILNFFAFQPALNYGFATRTQTWQQSPTDPGPLANRAALVDIMRFWLTRGVDGFRVDMADSLVKNDPDKQATIALWQEIFARIRPEFPGAVFVSEWGRPQQALEAGFDADFYLDWNFGGHPNGYHLLTRQAPDPVSRRKDQSFFNADNEVDACGFFDDYLHQYEEIKHLGSFSLITGNHDCPRLAPRLTESERALFFVFLLTMPGVPFIYYGDEIGTPFSHLPTHEGGYARTGARTPMPWDDEKQTSYLPLPVGCPTVTEALADPNSLYHTVRSLIRLRGEHPEFTGTDFEIHSMDKQLRYSRGAIQVAINLSRQNMPLPEDAEVLWQTSGANANKSEGVVGVVLPPLAAAVWR